MQLSFKAFKFALLDSIFSPRHFKPKEGCLGCCLGCEKTKGAEGSQGTILGAEFTSFLPTPILPAILILISPQTKSSSL